MVDVNCCKNQKMCNRSVDSYAYELEYVPDCYKTQNMCNQAYDTFPSVIQFVP